MPAGEPRQLVLDLPHRPALGEEDFLVSSSNAAAVSLVDRWPDWVLASALVTGSRGSGKSHLAHVWRLRSGAPLVSAHGIGGDTIDLLQRHRALAVENLDCGIADERMLFHLINIAREQKLSVLLTSACAPGALAVALPDLRSRLRALPVVAIEQPDETLLKAVMVKLFADRQIAIEPHVVEHIARRMERSMAAAGAIVGEIDRRALALHRKVTRTLASEVLAAFDSGGEAAP